MSTIRTRPGRLPTAGDLTKRRQQCPSCRAPVYWVITEKGKRMPVNIAPDEAKGNIRLELLPDENVGEYLVARVLPRGQIPGYRAAGLPLRTSHFVDCPKAAHHRRRTKGPRR